MQFNSAMLLMKTSKMTDSVKEMQLQNAFAMARQIWRRQTVDTLKFPWVRNEKLPKATESKSSSKILKKPQWWSTPLLHPSLSCTDES